MSSRLMVLGYILLFSLSCSSKYVSAPYGNVFFAYKAGSHGIASLPFRIESVEFLSLNGKAHRIYLGDKTLDMALFEPKFVKAAIVPAQSFSRIRWTISLKNSELLKYNVKDQRWQSIQMIDSNQKYVPQTRDTFIYESSLSEPLTITPKSNHFFLIEMHPEKSLSLANTQTAERYMLFDPQVSMRRVFKMPIHGELVSVEEKGDVKLNVSGVPMTVKAKAWSYQGETIKDLDEINSFLHRPVHLSAEISVDDDIQSDINIVDGIYYQGFIFQPDLSIQPVFKGHRFDPRAGYIYEPQVFLPDSIRRIYSGQRIAFYNTSEGVVADKNIQILASEIYVKVLDRQAEEFEVISVNHFEKGSFYNENLNVIAKLSEFNKPVEETLLLQGFFSDKGFYAETIKPVGKDIELNLNFYLFDDLMIFHETDEREVTRLFFLKSLSNAEGGVSLYGEEVPTSELINQIQLVPSSTLSLIIHRNKMTEHITFPDFKMFNRTLKKRIKQFKIMRFLGRGRATNESMLVNDFTITMGHEGFGSRSSSPMREDIFIDFNLMNETNKRQIEIDIESFSEIARRLKKHENPSSTRAKIEVETIYRSHLENLPEQDRISSSYNKDSYSMFFDGEGNEKCILLHASSRGKEYEQFMGKKPELMALLNKSIANNIAPVAKEMPKTIVQFNNGRLLLNADTQEVIPLTFNQATQSFEPLGEMGVAQEDVAHTYKETIFTIKKTMVGKQQLYTVEIKDEGLKKANNEGEKRNTVLLLVGDDEDKIKNCVQELIDSTPVNKRQEIYYGTDSGNDLHVLLDDHEKSQNKTRVSNVKDGRWNYYRLDLAEVSTIGKGTEATKFYYMPDSAIELADDVNRVIGTSDFGRTFGFNELTEHEDKLNVLNSGRAEKNPSELRVLIQLENDERVINPDIYKTFQRYPEHTIIVQMNNHGDFSIVNGIANIENFARPKYKNNVIFHLHGHGSRYHQGTKTPETLAKIVHAFKENAPKVIAKRFNENYPERQVSISDINMTPSHFVMDGCSLGDRGKWFVDTLTEKFSSAFVKFQAKEIGEVEISSFGLEPRQMIFSGESFTGKFIHSFTIAGSKEDIDNSRVIIYESWSKYSSIDSLGESRVIDEVNLLEDTKKYHQVYISGRNGFAERVDGIEYRQNPNGSVEFKLPYHIDAQPGFKKVFKGPLPAIVRELTRR